MAFTLTQPSYGQGGSYTALQDRFVLWGQAITPGVVRLGAVSGGASTGDLAVTVGTSPSTVKVSAGHGFVYGGSGQGVYHVYNDADISSTAFASCPTNTRIDLVVVQVTDNGVAAPSVAIAIVQGTAAASPSPPTAPAKSLVLAKVLIQNGFVSGTTNVLAANITDLRPKAQLPDISIPSITNNLSTGRVDTPYSPQTGNVIYDTSTPATPLLKVYNGSSWDTFTKSGAYGLSDFNYGGALGYVPVVICTSSTRPTGSAGMLIYETDTKRYLGYDGAAWQRVTYAAATARTGCTIKRAANQSIASGASVSYVSFDGEDYDSDGYFTATTTDLTIPTGFDGLYGVHFQVWWASNPGTASYARAKITPASGNLKMITGDGSAGAVSAFGGALYLHGGGAVIPLAAGDKVGIGVSQSSGGAINLTASLTCYRIGI